MGLAQWIRGSTVTTKRFVFAHTNFETGSATITPGSVHTLTGLASVLKCYPQARVELDGYTDSTGNPAANQKLSEDRASAVKDLLVKNGVDASRITTKGFGESHPLASNATPSGRAENRRTEMLVER
jgi:K(+)-stimulated pyrophosphate-energized sodium pump